MSGLYKEFGALNGSATDSLKQVRAERQKATLIAVIIFFLFVIVGSIWSMPAKGVRQRTELIFTTALIFVVASGVAIFVKVSLNRKAKEKLGEDREHFKLTVI